MTKRPPEGTATILFMAKHVGVAEPQRLFAVREQS